MRRILIGILLGLAAWPAWAGTEATDFFRIRDGYTTGPVVHAIDTTSATTYVDWNILGDVTATTGTASFLGFDAGSGGFTLGSATKGLYLSGSHIKVGADANAYLIIQDNDYAVFRLGGANELQLSPSSMIPSTNLGLDLGGTSNRWNGVYSSTGDYSGAVDIDGLLTLGGDLDMGVNWTFEDHASGSLFMDYSDTLVGTWSADGLNVVGRIEADNYYSGDGTQGATYESGTQIYFVDGNSYDNFVTVKDGLITEWSIVTP